MFHFVSTDIKISFDSNFMLPIYIPTYINYNKVDRLKLYYFLSMERKYNKSFCTSKL